MKTILNSSVPRSFSDRTSVDVQTIYVTLRNPWKTDTPKAFTLGRYGILERDVYEHLPGGSIYCFNTGFG